MASLPDAIRELEEDAILWISSLDTTAYAPGSSWEPTDVPLAPELDARTLGHLRFDARVVDGEHDAIYAGPVSGCSSGEQLDVLLRIVFYWRMPTEGSARRESALAAADAAEHAIRAMCSRPVGAERWAGIRTEGPPRREWVELVGGPAGAPWLRCTCDLRVPLFYKRDPVIPLPAGQAPVIYPPPSIVGTRGAGNTLTAWPGLSTGTAPITYSYQWLLDGSPISGATASSYVDPDGAGVLSVTVTHTNAYGSDSETSQPLAGVGGLPEITASPAIDSLAGNSVGDEISVSNGTWSNGPILEYGYRPTRGGTPIVGETASAYTLAQPDDPGESIGYEVRARNAAGWSSWATATGAVVCRPYWTASPTFSGTNAVGQTLTGSAGTVLGSTSTGYEWIVGGVGTGDTDTSYTIQAADAGDTVVYRGTASNAGGSTVSNSSSATVLPYWSAIPTLAGEPWPGGTVTSDEGTVAGETSGPTYAWEIGGVATGDTGATSKVVAVDEYAGLLTQEGSASNAGGASTVDSFALALEEVVGINRAAIVDDWFEKASFTIPSAFTLLVEFVGIATAASTNGILICLGSQSGSTATRREVAIYLLSAGNAIGGLLRNGANTGVITISAAGVLDGSTRWMAAIRFNTTGSVFSVSAIPPNGTATHDSTYDSGSFQNASGAAHPAAAFRRTASLVAGTLPALEVAARLDAVILDRVLSDSDLQAIADAGSLQAWGAYTDSDLVLRFSPAAGQVSDADTIDESADVTDSFVRNAGTARCTVVALNEVIP